MFTYVIVQAHVSIIIVRTVEVSVIASMRSSKLHLNLQRRPGHCVDGSSESSAIILLFHISPYQYGFPYFFGQT